MAVTFITGPQAVLVGELRGYKASLTSRVTLKPRAQREPKKPGIKTYWTGPITQTEVTEVAPSSKDIHTNVDTNELSGGKSFNPTLLSCLCLPVFAHHSDQAVPLNLSHKSTRPRTLLTLHFQHRDLMQGNSQTFLSFFHPVHNNLISCFQALRQASAGGGTRIRDRRFLADLRVESLATVSPTPHNIQEN
ncbi:hypothetical protein PoB_003781100 [Plakobranchus ocellatus]|uniref:Uncharacterized protein n=1 Tax=Plakobranchus ocellatus TaxID=259542 RepID=A0AAV4AJF2_9GAST|nr:hypothetical protein PoB_003781100 [Plakobranchus ocellatus]